MSNMVLSSAVISFGSYSIPNWLDGRRSDVETSKEISSFLDV